MIPIIGHKTSPDQRGILFAVTSAILLGLTPIFGKQAILAGLDPLTTVALRTAGAVTLLFIALAVFKRTFFYIYPIGLAGCVLAGFTNGLGSVFFYAALGRIDASLGQFLFTLYPVFVASLVYLDGQRPSRLSITRLAISIVGVFLLTQNRSSNIDLTGVLLMLLAAFLYALHIPINQRVLYEVPAPTVTFYTLLSMTAVVLMVKLILTGTSFRIPAPALQPILWLTLVTFGSRLALFAGVKAIGGVQTALIGLLELLVTVLLAIIFLGESFGLRQWIGATLLIATLILSAFEKDLKTSHITRGWLFWLRPSKPITLPEPEISEDTKISPEG